MTEVQNIYIFMILSFRHNRFLGFKNCIITRNLFINPQWKAIKWKCASNNEKRRKEGNMRAVNCALSVSSIVWKPQYIICYIFRNKYFLEKAYLIVISLKSEGDYRFWKYETMFMLLQCNRRERESETKKKISYIFLY